jgi:hypothetical protein
MFVQKDQGIQGLSLSGRRHGFIDRQMIKKSLDVGFIQGGWMLLLMKVNVLAYPIAIALFGTGTVMPAANGQTQLFK